MSVRLYAILARESHRAVVFRRGPSKQVLLVSWNTDTDAFTEGQWLKGRIYERRCDLSPDGELLLYFAANWKERTGRGVRSAGRRISPRSRCGRRDMGGAGAGGS